MGFHIFHNHFPRFRVSQFYYLVLSNTHQSFSIWREFYASTRPLMSFCLPLLRRGASYVVLIATITIEKTLNTSTHVLPAVQWPGEVLMDAMRSQIPPKATPSSNRKQKIEKIDVAILGMITSASQFPNRILKRRTFLRNPPQRSEDK